MRNLKVTLEYDGAAYHGFQSQNNPRLPTIQGVVEKVLSELAEEQVNIVGASRTDAGVHARGQVFNFRTNWAIPVDKLPLAANSGGLPPDIVMLAVEEVPLDFHAQFVAKAKTYTYTIYNARIPNAFYHRYAYYVPQRLNLAAMAAALPHFIGTHDFAAFKAVGSKVRSNVRTIFDCQMDQKGPLIVFTLKGNGFLYNMIRIIVGTVIDVGKGKIKPEDIPLIIASGNRARAGKTAAPHGLCLETIEY